MYKLCKPFPFPLPSIRVVGGASSPKLPPEGLHRRGSSAGRERELVAEEGEERIQRGHRRNHSSPDSDLGRVASVGAMEGGGERGRAE